MCIFVKCMDDRAVNTVDNDDANEEDMVENFSSSLENIHTRRNGRRRHHRIGEEIELYCNPFVEVYGRFSTWARRLARRWVESMVGMLMGVEEVMVWREILYVVDHTAW